MDELKTLRQKIKEFNKDRDWEQFHNPKDLALSLVLEASEVLEHFQWKKSEEMEEYLTTHKEELGDELADVFIYLLEICDKAGVDLFEAAHHKIAKNEKKHPVEKSKGSAKKYTELK